MFKRLALAALAALSVAFASPAFADPIADFNHFLNSVSTFTVADANAALADATARGDKPAIQCYSGALAYAQANPVQVQLPNLPTPVGAITAFQTARDVVKDAETAQVNLSKNVIPDPINAACGWLALDVQADVAKVNAKAASFVLFGIKL